MTYEKFYMKSVRPLSGKYIYKDLFQIYPIDKEVAIDGKMQRDYLCAIEIKVNKSVEYRYTYPFEKGELARMAIEIMHLISIATKFYFFELSGPEEFSLSSFTDNDNKEIVLKDVPYYLNLKLDVVGIDYVVFPENIDLILDNYYSLNVENRQAFRKATYLFYTAVEIETIRTSFSFVSLISSIECLISYSFENKNTKCEKCGQEKYSISKKFKWFIRYFTKIDDNVFLNKLYSFRSKIVHSGELFLSDLLWNESNNDAGDIFKDYFARKNMILITRACILNWNDYVIQNNNLIKLKIQN